jgi:gamma-glutamylcyclotransferase (GGCT)/AIG2-like uncharacterized protein YtfP
VSGIVALLFSYGTLQHPEVQVATFGRLLSGCPDELIGYELWELPVADLRVVEMSGKTLHPTACFTGVPASRVKGTVFEVTEDELARVDHYGVLAHRRTKSVLRSGREAWIYTSGSDPL